MIERTRVKSMTYWNMILNELRDESALASTRDSHQSNHDIVSPVVIQH
jgi:hypothetical protein